MFLESNHTSLSFLHFWTAIEYVDKSIIYCSRVSEHDYPVFFIDEVSMDETTRINIIFDKIEEKPRHVNNNMLLSMIRELNWICNHDSY